MDGFATYNNLWMLMHIPKNYLWQFMQFIYAIIPFLILWKLKSLNMFFLGLCTKIKNAKLSLDPRKTTSNALVGHSHSDSIEEHWDLISMPSHLAPNCIEDGLNSMNGVFFFFKLLREDMPICIIFFNLKFPKLGMRKMNFMWIYRKALMLWWRRVKLEINHFYIVDSEVCGVLLLIQSCLGKVVPKVSNYQ